MIFGGLQLSGFKNDLNKINEIVSLMNWPGARVFSANLKNFKGGFFLNTSLPYQLQDFLFINSNKEILILFSGNIYNRDEFFSEIKCNENIPNPVLVYELFLRFGPGFVEKLNGDFALIIYNSIDEEIFLFRDHLGIQPLCYTIQNDNLFFSSDCLSLCRAFHEGGPIQIEPLISDFKGVDHLLTFNKKIKKIIPAHYINLKNGEINTQKYWFPERIKTNTNLKFDQIITEVEKLLLNSIYVRSDNRFYAGAHLSGGLDSSLVASISRGFFPEQEPFYGFSWSPDGPASTEIIYDERVYVKEVAKYGNLFPVFSTIKKEDFLEYLNCFIDNLGYFSEVKTIEKAKQFNVNLIFSGWGGDEFFSKEGSGIDSDLLTHLKFHKFFLRNPLNKPRKLAQTLYYYVLFPYLGILDHQAKKNFKKEGKYLKKDAKKHFLPTIKRSFFYKSRRERHLNFIYNYHLSERTEQWAVIGYKKGVEYRYPLLDKRIIELFLKIPSWEMVEGSSSRIIAREIGKKWLPETVINRKSFLDPVLFSSSFMFLPDMSALFYKELNEWKQNPDLNFIDFHSLEKDYELFKRNPYAKNFKKLHGNIIYCKGLHEFTKTYRSLPQDSE